MNVLLAEADVPYEQLKEMDEINTELPQTDVVVILGANDVVNPAARSDTSSPIYGMPIIDVDRAGTVVVVKRSLSPGFAGIDNPLFYDPKTSMLFADAKQALEDVGAALKGLAAVRSFRPATSRPRCRRSARTTRCATPSWPTPAASGDAAEAVRDELPSRRLPGDAGARRRARALEVGDIVPRQPARGLPTVSGSWCSRTPRRGSWRRFWTPVP